MVERVRRKRKKRSDRGRPSQHQIRSRLESNAVDESLFASVRKFLVFLVIMLGILWLSIHYLNRAWDQKLQAAQINTAPPVSMESNTVEEADSELASTNQPPEAWTSILARAEASLDSDPALSALLYEKVLLAEPEYVDGLSALAGIYIRNEQFSKALPLLEKALLYRAEEARLWSDYGLVLYMLRNYKDSEQAFERVLTFKDPPPSAHYNMALVSLALQNFDKAYTAIRRFTSLAEDNINGWLLKAELEREKEELEEALRSVERALAMNGDIQKLYLKAASIAALTGQYDKAEAYLRQAEEKGRQTDVYRYFKTQSFSEMRQSPSGRAYERELFARVQEVMARSKAMKQISSMHDPIWSD